MITINFYVSRTALNSYCIILLEHKKKVFGLGARSCINFFTKMLTESLTQSTFSYHRCTTQHALPFTKPLAFTKPLHKLYFLVCVPS